MMMKKRFKKIRSQQKRSHQLKQQRLYPTWLHLIKMEWSHLDLRPLMKRLSLPAKMALQSCPPPPKWAFEDVLFEYGEPFQCPICYTEQVVKNKHAWKKHVFRDLKPYICTFQECKMRMFRSRNEWFAHELQCHRREWACQYCQHSAFTSAESFSRHIASAHPTILAHSKIEAIILQSEEPVTKISSKACPLCNEWEEKFSGSWHDRKRLVENTEAIEPYGTPKQFRRHLGRHMEQLALFALPVNASDDSDHESLDEEPDREEEDGTDSDYYAESDPQLVLIKGPSLLPEHQELTSPQPHASPAMSTSVKRACDACHRRKLKCDGINPCRNCSSAQLSCTYHAIPQQKDPKGSRAKLERSDLDPADNEDAKRASSPHHETGHETNDITAANEAAQKEAFDDLNTPKLELSKEESERLEQEALNDLLNEEKRTSQRSRHQLELEVDESLAPTTSEIYATLIRDIAEEEKAILERKLEDEKKAVLEAYETAQTAAAEVRVEAARKAAEEKAAWERKVEEEKKIALAHFEAAQKAAAEAASEAVKKAADEKAAWEKKLEEERDALDIRDKEEKAAFAKLLDTLKAQEARSLGNEQPPESLDNNISSTREQEPRRPVSVDEVDETTGMPVLGTRRSAVSGEKPEVSRERERRSKDEVEEGISPIQRQRSRQDLPALETKVPREIPPQFRRSMSSVASLPKDKDETLKASTPPEHSFPLLPFDGGSLPFRTDSKPRFSDPPAPPPQEPLPEKPDVPRSHAFEPSSPSLKRSKTDERIEMTGKRLPKAKLDEKATKLSPQARRELNALSDAMQIERRERERVADKELNNHLNIGIKTWRKKEGPMSGEIVESTASNSKGKQPSQTPPLQQSTRREPIVMLDSGPGSPPEILREHTFPTPDAPITSTIFDTVDGLPPERERSGNTSERPFEHPQVHYQGPSSSADYFSGERPIERERVPYQARPSWADNVSSAAVVDETVDNKVREEVDSQPPEGVSSELIAKITEKVKKELLEHLKQTGSKDEEPALQGTSSPLGPAPVVQTSYIVRGRDDGVPARHRSRSRRRRPSISPPPDSLPPTPVIDRDFVFNFEGDAIDQNERRIPVTPQGKESVSIDHPSDIRERRFDNREDRDREREERILALEAERQREERILAQDEEIRLRRVIPGPLPPLPPPRRMIWNPVVTSPENPDPNDSETRDNVKQSGGDPIDLTDGSSRNNYPFQGIKCPTCAANGQEVWVIPGRSCSYCGTNC
ncbi:uncharacterized protein LY89DRAFT_478685 [Mollisia scopiformis]|uniref:Zn(2)-C6 fungal-type domain-containing protein n=1 Tax=Mollisia scopiformis TaxID=149040 RepID=A0A194XG42_MOLSC|nr:uncharacterized protein LY89DRAFT_478685 [Mollisia scopiformis]KUJ19143.1 hypothetical protein LY89DRAFT_478685 [Mollisia scopiformis]